MAPEAAAVPLMEPVPGAAVASTSLPFASPNAFVQARTNLPAVRTVFMLAQEQHRAILDAIENREGMRAQMLAIEHSRSAWKNFKLALDEARTPGELPGANLIRFRRLSQ